MHADWGIRPVVRKPQKTVTRERLEAMISELERQEVRKLPPESELMQLLDVGRNTLRGAVGELEQEGRIERIQGKGTYISLRQDVLRFANWMAAETPSPDALPRVIEGFHAINPTTLIESVGLPYRNYLSGMQGLIRDHETPDVLLLTPYWLQQLHRAGVLRSLDDLVSPENVNRRYTNDIEACRDKDKLYALNWTLAPLVLYYNKHVMRQAGLDPERPPRTLEELEQTACYVQDNTDERTYGICLPFDPYEPNFMWLYVFLLSFEGGFTDAVGNIIIDGDRNRNALQWLRSLVARAGTPTRKTVHDTRILFSTDHVAFIIDGPYGRAFYRSIGNKEFGKDYGVHTVPVGTSNRSETVLLTHALAISNQCHHPDKAYKWIEYLTTNREVAEVYFGETGLVPAVRNVLHDRFFTEDEFAGTLIQQIETAGIGPVRHELFGPSLPFMMQVLSEIVLGERELDEGMTFLNSILEIIARSRSMLA